jgi:hypothetical protein
MILECVAERIGRAASGGGGVQKACSGEAAIAIFALRQRIAHRGEPLSAVMCKRHPRALRLEDGGAHIARVKFKPPDIAGWIGARDLPVEAVIGDAPHDPEHAGGLRNAVDCVIGRRCFRPVSGTDIGYVVVEVVAWDGCSGRPVHKARNAALEIAGAGGAGVGQEIAGQIIGEAGLLALAIDGGEPPVYRILGLRGHVRQVHAKGADRGRDTAAIVQAHLLHKGQRVADLGETAIDVFEHCLQKCVRFCVKRCDKTKT